MEILFRKQNTGLLGIELEGMLIDPVLGKELTCVNKEMLHTLKQFNLDVSPEASAAQLELKTKPLQTCNVAYDLCKLTRKLKTVLYNKFNLAWSAKAYASPNLDLDFYPGDIRYKQMFANLDLDSRRFVMSAMALHIHIGCSDKKAALRLYRMLLQDIDFFIRRDYDMRLELYIKMVRCALPPRYNYWSDFEKDARDRGFSENTSNNHSLIRITKHGTVELRMFNANEDFESMEKLLKYLERYTVWA